VCLEFVDDVATASGVVVFGRRKRDSGAKKHGGNIREIRGAFDSAGCSLRREAVVRHTVTQKVGLLYLVLGT
jgi:hypothetical protein